MTAAYVERAPAAGLLPFVVCTWANGAGNTEASGPILPDGCADIVWNGRALFVAGPDTGPVVLESDHEGSGYAGVRFRPGAGAGLLGVPVSDLRDQRVPMEAIWGDDATRRLSDRLAATISTGDACAVLEAALIDRRTDPVDPLVVGAVRAIASEPSLRIAGLAARLGVTDRTLHRRVQSAVGYGPKMLQRVARFRRFLTLAASCDDLGLAAVAHGAGYADQAHLTRECRALSGSTPARLVRAPGVRIVQDGLAPVGAS